MRLITSAIAISLLALSLSPAHADSRHDSRRDDDSHDSRDHRRHDRDEHRDHRDRRDHSRHETRRDDRRYSYNDGRDNHRYNQNGRHYDYNRGDRRYVESRPYYPPVVHGPVYRDRFYADSYYRPDGYRAYSWHRGDRLPPSYYAPRYVVSDYYSYHLGPPPRGHHWVRVDNDVVLAAITTGIVVQVVSDLFH